MVGTLFYQIESDDYEPAFALGKTLMDNKCADPYVPAMAGIAAYCVNDYDLAEPWLKSAQASGKLNEFASESSETTARAAALLPRLAGVSRRRQGKLGQGKEDPRGRGQGRRPAARPVEDQQGTTSSSNCSRTRPPTPSLNFITLVEKGFYDGVPFHRVLPGFMAQGGDPEGNGRRWTGLHDP